MTEQTVENTEIITETVEPVVVDDTAEMGAAWDRLMVQNGADRGEDGKFVSPDAQGAEPAPVDAGSSGGEDGAGAVDASSTVVATVPAPAHLPQALKNEWEKMPEAARNEVAKLTGEWDRKFGELGKQYQAVKPLGDMMSGLKGQFPEYFGNRDINQIAQGAAELAVVQAKLDKDPVGTLLQVMDVYKVTDAMRAALNGQQPTQESHVINQLQQTIRGLQQKLEEVGNPAFIEQHVSKVMGARDTQNLVTELATGKEFYADVEASLPAFIGMAWQRLGESASRKEVFDLAYDMAVNADPAVRAKAKASEAKATVAKSDPQRTEAAKKAASINVKSSSSGKERPLTFEESAGAAYDRLMAN